MDYFYFFFHLGLDLLKQGGVLGFITTNYFVTATYASKLVDDLRLRSSPVTFLNFNEIRLFESATGQHNLITMLIKTDSDRECAVFSVKADYAGRPSAEFLARVLQGDGQLVNRLQIPKSQLFDGSQIRIAGSTELQSSAELEVMAKSGLRLGDFYAVRQGVLTGSDRVSKAHLAKFPNQSFDLGDGIFVLSDDELKALDLDTSEMEIIKPYYKNSSINRYVVSEDQHKWLIYANSSEQNLERRNSLKNHLDQFSLIIDASSDNSPYLHRPRNFDFESPSIVVPQRSKENTFALTDGPFYSSADVYFIGLTNKSPFSLSALLGMLNSDLYYQWLYQRGKRKGEMLELFQVPISDLPLPTFSDETHKLSQELASAVNVLRENLREEPNFDPTPLQDSINKITRSLFGLT
jgi:adenine-specific DNA-methyltransferase